MVGFGDADLEQRSYEELAARNAELTARVAELLAVVAEQAALIGTLGAEVAALRRQADRDSNSSQPPSQDGPAAKAKADRREARAGAAGPAAGRAEKAIRVRAWRWTARPDETLAVEPGTCGGCGADWPALRAGSRPACRWSISRRPR